VRTAERQRVSTSNPNFFCVWYSAFDFPPGKRADKPQHRARRYKGKNFRGLVAAIECMNKDNPQGMNLMAQHPDIGPHTYNG
jgi:hypothetical protein